MRIPRSEAIGSGPRKWVIKIRQAADEELQERFHGRCHECHALQTDTAHPGVHGFWDAGTRTIWLNKSDSDEQKIWDIYHEMFHAMNDWLWANYRGRA